MLPVINVYPKEQDKVQAFLWVRVFTCSTRGPLLG